MTINELIVHAQRLGWKVACLGDIQFADAAWFARYNPRTKQLVWWRTECGSMSAEPDDVRQKLLDLRGTA